MLFEPECATKFAKTVTDLVSIKSLSGDEAPAAAYVQAFLTHLGIPSERDTEDNIIAVLEPAQPGAPRENTLHLSGHTDTVVPVEGWQSDPWKPFVAGDDDEKRIVGLGTSDMKSGLAIMLHLLEYFSKNRLKKMHIVASFTVCEECPAKGKRNGVHRVLEKHPGRWALTTEASCEQTCPTIAVGCQGHAVAHVTLRGRSAHSASPDRGLNAIHAAAKICARVERLHRSFSDIDILGRVQARGAAAVTLMKGGSAGNIVPEHCEMTISRRVAPGETIAAVERQLAGLLEDLDGVSATWTMRCDAPACVVEANGPLLKCASAASQALFQQVRYTWNRARTDMVLFKQAGMDVLNIGPGFAGQAHVAGEYVRIIDLPRSANLVGETIKRLDKTLYDE